MKPINPIMICLFFCSLCYTQTHSESIADAMVAGQKTTINGLLAAEIALLNQQRHLIWQLKNEEDTYQDKIGPLSNISNSLVFTAVQTMLNTLGGKISDIEYNIKLRKYATFGIRHGLSRHEAELERQKEYFNALKKENEILLAYAAVSGGAGYNYTAFLKLLLRTMKIRANIFRIDKDIKALMKASWLLSR